MRIYPRWTLLLYVLDNWKLTFYQFFFYKNNNFNVLPYPKQSSKNYQKHASTQSPSNSFRYTVRYWTFVVFSDFWNIKRIKNDIWLFECWWCLRLVNSSTQKWQYFIRICMLPYDKYIFREICPSPVGEC